MVEERFVPKPSVLMANILEILAEGRYIDQLTITITNYVVGVVFGTVVGVSLALALYTVKYAKSLLTPYILLLSVVPKVIFFPIFVKLFVVEEVIKIAFIAILYVAIFVYLGVVSNLDLLDVNYLRLFRVYTRSHLKIFRKLLLPTVFYSLLANIRLAVVFALVGAIFADMMLAPGVGYILLILAYSFRTSELYAVIVLIAATAVALNLLMKYLEDWASKHLRTEQITKISLWFN
ncbi:MAG: ABC transporter permease subunit [Candidatus Caldarchaeum sp.]|nr:ABC transporter permease subunit [Candidatus Caldarchaeum sp.]